MGFSRQEYWSGLSFPTPGDLPDPGIEPTSLASPALAGRFFITASVGKPRLVPGTYSLNRQKKKKKPGKPIISSDDISTTEFFLIRTS